ncbi:DNA primase [Lactobacillus phage LpeD]|uniref:DNA primase n=1 Tax=Lactobacillus phage LpeD TaxID=2041210 RepID=A0A291I9H3_9CAUD|nr:DNA primase [Lactobacillus phage LpeD]ATG86346.1 DNA primase [Lactobacillus phage LpeD]
MSDGNILYDGDDMRFNCPLCGEQKNKLYVNSDGVYHCFHCAVSGFGAITFLSKYYDVSYSEASRLAKEYGYSKEEFTAPVTTGNNLANNLLVMLSESNDSSISKLTMPPLPTGTKHLITNWDNPEAYPYFEYLINRSVTKEDIIKYDICYCIQGTARTSRGVIGINKSIVFISKHNGLPIYWNTRSIEKAPFIKSFNSYAIPGKEYSRSQSLFNYDSIYSDNIVVCEGVFNAITISHIKGYSGVATFGKEVTDSQLDILTKTKGTLYLFLDNDANSKIVELGRRILERGISSERIRLVNNPYVGKDANDLGEDICLKLLQESKPLGLGSMLSLIK